MRVWGGRRGLQTLQFLNPDCLLQQRLFTKYRCKSSTTRTAEGSSNIPSLLMRCNSLNHNLQFIDSIGYVLQHEAMNQSFQMDMWTSWGRLSRVCIGATGNMGKPRPQSLQHDDTKLPFQRFNAPPTPTYLTPRTLPWNQLYWWTVMLAVWTRPWSKGLPRDRAHPPYGRLYAIPEYQTAGRYDTLYIWSANLCSSTTCSKNSILH